MKSRHRGLTASSVPRACVSRSHSCGASTLRLLRDRRLLHGLQREKNRRASHRLGAPNLARAIGGMHWPCEGTPVRSVATAHPGNMHSPATADSNSRSRTHTSRRKYSHEYKPHCIAVNSTSAGSALPPRSHSHQPPAVMLVHASTRRPRSNVVDGNEHPFRSLLLPTHSGYCINVCTTVSRSVHSNIT